MREFKREERMAHDYDQRIIGVFERSTKKVASTESDHEWCVTAMEAADDSYNRSVIGAAVGGDWYDFNDASGSDTGDADDDNYSQSAAAADFVFSVPMSSLSELMAISNFGERAMSTLTSARQSLEP